MSRVVCPGWTGGRFDQLSRSGVRWVWRANRTFSDTVEPEHVVLSGDQTKAYISLQVNLYHRHHFRHEERWGKSVNILNKGGVEEGGSLQTL